MQEKLGPERVAVVGVSVDEECSLAAKIAQEKHATWPQVCDGAGLDGELPRLFNARGTPNYYLIDPDGRLAAKRVRAEELEALLAEVEAR